MRKHNPTPALLAVTENIADVRICIISTPCSTLVEMGHFQVEQQVDSCNMAG